MAVPSEPPGRRPSDPVDDQRVERVIAASRIFLASAGLLALMVEGPLPTVSTVAAYTVLIVYVLFAASWLVVLRVRPAVTWAFAVGTHLVDIAVAASLTLSTEGTNGRFFVFLNYPLLTSAYRWGLRGTLSTSVAALTLFAIETLLFSSVAAPGTLTLQPDLSPTRPLLRVTYFVIVGLLVGFLADSEKRRRSEAFWISRMLRDARVGRPLEETYEHALASIAGLFGARRALLVLQETRSGRTFIREFGASTSEPDGHRTIEVPGDQRSDYLFALPGAALHGVRRRRGAALSVVAVDASGIGLKRQAVTIPMPFLHAYPCRRLIAASTEFEGHWNSRVFVFDPAYVLSRVESARVAQRVMTQVGPALYDRYLLRRLRSKAAEDERARLMREFHDGPMQSLLGVEMGLAALRRKADAEAPQVASDLAQFHEALKREVISMRDTFEGIRAAAAPFRPIAQDLSQMVSRFGVHAAIDARFVDDGAPVVLTARARREVLRITHEALMNVRKHSGARRVTVESGLHDGRFTLRVEDDGHGFPFAGARGTADFRANGGGPWTILERVQSINGTLTITSRPGAGACVEVVLPAELAVGAKP